MNRLVSGAVKIGDSLKPVLKKFIPEWALRDAKKRVLERAYVDMVKKGRKPFDREYKPDGINLIGLVRAQMGLGQSCRLLANTIENSNILYTLYDFALPNPLLRADDHTYDEKISDELKYNINLIHINPDEMGLLYARFPKESWDYCYNIAFWLWELQEIPEEWSKYYPMLDEIWTPSEFISKNLRKVTSLPVKTLPYWVTAKTDIKYDREFFCLPENIFLFLTMYDSNSTMERKNPMGAVNAFKKAFKPDNKSVGLVVKINNTREEDVDILKGALKNYSNIFYITDTLEKIQVNSLIKACDVFISLHRAEGFGLVMAEAMLVGTVTIATDWSSNTEFMNEDVACMVPCSFKALDRDCPPYKEGIIWAEPNEDCAAEYMKRLVGDQEYYENLRVQAKDYIHKKLGREQAIQSLQKSVLDIYNGRN